MRQEVEEEERREEEEEEERKIKGEQATNRTRRPSLSCSARLSGLFLVCRCTAV